MKALAFEGASLGHEVEMLSHDIRSAVSDVIGGLRLIEMQDIDPSLREQLGGVQEASEVLARLVEDALVLVSGDATPPPMAGNLHLYRMLDDKQKRWAVRARRAGATFEFHRADDLPEVVQLDRLALERVLSNLISNAVKYANDGEVTVRVVMDPDHALVFTVLDSGPGFSDAALASMFSAGARPEGSAQAGTGLGLHISKRNADQLGGVLRAFNRAEGGAQCTLSIPAHRWRATEVDTSLLPDLSPYRVLVADDNDTNQLLVSQMLATMGAECEIASDGIEALNWLARENFDLALIDIEMPRLGGIEVLRAERDRQSRGLAPRMALVAMTAYVLRDNRDAIYSAGADGILAKPLVSIESFGHAILHYIVATREALQHPEADSVASGGTTFHIETLNTLLGVAGPTQADELMRRLLADLANVQAELDIAMENSALDVIRAQTHVLISLSAAVGAGQCLKLARYLNTAARGGQNRDALVSSGHNLVRVLAELRAELGAFETSRKRVKL